LGHKISVTASNPYTTAADVSQELAYISPNTQGTCNFHEHMVIGSKKRQFQAVKTKIYKAYNMQNINEKQSTKCSFKFAKKLKI
jgi:hypothetical protein